MEWYEAAALLVGIVVALMLLGVPVAFAFLASNLVGALVFMGRVPRLPADHRQRDRVGDYLRAGAGAVVHHHGRIVLPHRACDPRVRRARQVLRAYPGPAQLHHGGRRHDLRHPVGLDDGQHGDDGRADGARHDAARLQAPHVDGPDPRDRRARDDHPAVRARGAAGEPCRDRHRGAPDRRRDTGADPGRALRDADLRPGADRSRGRPRLRRRILDPGRGRARGGGQHPADERRGLLRDRADHPRGRHPDRGRRVRRVRRDGARRRLPRADLGRARQVVHGGRSASPRWCC